jgi:hypothetical protein
VLLEGIGLRSFTNLTIEGEALVTDTPITLLGFVDHTTGTIVEKNHPLFGKSIKNKIFIFPRSSGSTVGPYVLINLKDNNTAPMGILNRESDSITVAGCSVARIPLGYRLTQDPTKIIKTDDWVRMELKQGKLKVIIT